MPSQQLLLADIISSVNLLHCIFQSTYQLIDISWQEIVLFPKNGKSRRSCSRAIWLNGTGARSHEKEMRRPAPQDHPNKKQRREDAPYPTDASDFVELNRFDYQASDNLPEDSRGFIVTCSFRRCVHYTVPHTAVC
jgi:hypothetical protein